MKSIKYRPILVVFFILFSSWLPLNAQEGQASLPADTWPQLKTLTGIKIAEEPSDMVQLIVLFDANCPHCAELWLHIYGKTSRYRHVISLWAPVVYMNKNSAGKAAGLLNANSSLALADNFENFDYSRRSGAAASAEVTSSIRLSLDRNTRTWEKIMAATPLLIYKTRDGQVRTQTGLPSKAVLDDLLDKLAPARLENFNR